MRLLSRLDDERSRRGAVPSFAWAPVLGFLPKPFTASQLTRGDLVCHFPAIA